MVAPRVEGLPHCDWVLVDAGDVIIHVFRPEVRAFYNLEKMWGGDRPSEVAGDRRASSEARGRARREADPGRGRPAQGRPRAGSLRRAMSSERRAAARRVGLSGLDVRETRGKPRADGPRTARRRRPGRCARWSPPGARICRARRARRKSVQRGFRSPHRQGPRRRRARPHSRSSAAPDGLDPALRARGRARARVRRDDVAAPARARHGGGADLSRDDHPVRPSLSSRLTCRRDRPGLC